MPRITKKQLTRTVDELTKENANLRSSCEDLQQSRKIQTIAFRKQQEELKEVKLNYDSLKIDAEQLELAMKVDAETITTLRADIEQLHNTIDKYRKVLYTLAEHMVGRTV